MSRCYLVSYDISDPKRLRQVFKLLKGYGEHWQLSIFFCVLKDVDRLHMQLELQEIINSNEDQVFIVDLGENEEDARASVWVIGPPLPEGQSGLVVV